MLFSCWFPSAGLGASGGRQSCWDTTGLPERWAGFLGTRQATHAECTTELLHSGSSAHSCCQSALRLGWTWESLLWSLASLYLCPNRFACHWYPNGNQLHLKSFLYWALSAGSCPWASTVLSNRIGAAGMGETS